MHIYTDADLFKSDSCQFESVAALPSRLEFEEIDDFAGDVSDVTRTIERDGMIVPEYGAFIVV